LVTFVLDAPEVICLRELIRLRVREEVARYNAPPTPRFHGLIRPEEAEGRPERIVDTATLTH